MNRYERRLTRLTDWAIDRSWSQTMAQHHERSKDAEWSRIAEALGSLADRVTDPAPVTFRVDPTMAANYARKAGVSPAEFRDEWWRHWRLLETPEGQRLARALVRQSRHAARSR